MMIKKSYYFIAASIGVVYFLWVFGAQPLNPKNVEWLLNGDTLNSYSGWLFYRTSPWSMPLGLVTTWVPSLEITVIQTDSIPIIAMLVKTFNSWLSTPFQYFGIWLLACYSLQGLFAAKIVRLMTNDALLGLLAAAFFVLSPPLLWRLDHKSLCAHWLILAAFWVYLNFVKGAGLCQALLKMSAILLLALMIHPYFFAMLFPLQFALIAAGWRAGGFKGASWEPKIILALQLPIIFGVAWLVGFFQIQSSAIWGWPRFSTDLLAFVNSYGNSGFLPSIRHGGSQHEGYAYLGLGIIFLGFWSFPSWQKRKFWSLNDRYGVWLTPLWTICILLWIYALSSHITFGGNTIIKLDFFYDYFHSITGTFRASGRFLWPLYYWIVLSILLLVAAHRTSPQARLLFSVALAVQIADLHGWITATEKHIHPSSLVVLSDSRWESIPQHFSEIKLIPPRLIAEGFSCGDNTFPGALMNSLQYFAATHHMTFNSSLAARSNSSSTAALCTLTHSELENKTIIPSAAYVVSTEPGPWLSLFKQNLAANLDCVDNKDYLLCLPKLSQVGR